MELLRVDEVARRLRLGKSTVYALCDRGLLPHVRFGSSIRVPADALERLIAEQTYVPEATR